MIIVSTAGPLITTYIFSRGISALETHQEFIVVIEFFMIFAIILICENTLRLVAKAKIAVYAEEAIMNIQKTLISFIDPIGEDRKEIIQAIRNLTDAIGGFIVFARDSGMGAVINFISVPTILFFIDKKIFLLELALITVYIFTTRIFAKIYEKHFEKLDKAKEHYFSQILISNHVVHQAVELLKILARVVRVWALGWISAQNLIAVFNFFVVFLVVKDIVHGTKQISDLVLIIGYTNQSQGFLNSITTAMESLMQIKAGLERVHVVTKSKSLISV